MMLTLLLSTSCSKNDDDEVLAPDTQNEKAITQAEMQNNSNPFDGQREMFNGFLKVLANNGDLGGWDVSQLTQFNGDLGGWDVSQIANYNGDLGGWDVSQIIDQAMDYNEENGKASGDVARESLFMQIEGISGMGVFSPIDDCLWRPDRCRLFKLAIAVLDSSNGGTARDRTLNFINSIRDQEAEIQGNGEIEQTEKDMLLISLSIARQAAGYWFNQTRETDVPMDKVSPKMIQLSTLGASTALMSVDSKEVGVSAAILSAYVASGKAN